VGEEVKRRKNMEVLEVVIGFCIPFAIIGFLWRGAKEDWKRSK
jgi:hypothetical protein